MSSVVTPVQSPSSSGQESSSTCPYMSNRKGRLGKIWEVIDSIPDDPQIQLDLVKYSWENVQSLASEGFTWKTPPDNEAGTLADYGNSMKALREDAVSAMRGATREESIAIYEKLEKDVDEVDSLLRGQFSEIFGFFEKDMEKRGTKRNYLTRVDDRLQSFMSSYTREHIPRRKRSWCPAR